MFEWYRAHLNASLIQTGQDCNIIRSLIPVGTTGLTQTLDVAKNKPFEGLVRKFVEEARDQKEREGIEKWSIDQHRIMTTEAIGNTACVIPRPWPRWCYPT